MAGVVVDSWGRCGLVMSCKMCDESGDYGTNAVRAGNGNDNLLLMMMRMKMMMLGLLLLLGCWDGEGWGLLWEGLMGSLKRAGGGRGGGGGWDEV